MTAQSLLGQATRDRIRLDIVMDECSVCGGSMGNGALWPNHIHDDQDAWVDTQNALDDLDEHRSTTS